ncbi:Epoxide hydrolase 3, partial [Mucuna pruriens]
MVNVVTAYCSLLRWLMKTVGLRQYMVEVEAGTVVRFWVPCDTVSKHELVSKPSKPVVVLLHGFCGEGIINWQFQVGALTKEYAVYVADLLFFGGSVSDKAERSPEFQAECLAVGLGKLGVEKCVVVGFSYGGCVALKMGEMYVELVEAIVVTGFVVAIMEWIVLRAAQANGYSSCSQMLLPTSVEELKTLFSVGAHKNFCLPNCFYSHFLQAMYFNRKERAELLEALENSYKDINIPNFQQRIHFLWGENDKIFKPELAQKMKEKLGNNTTCEFIKNAGHLVHLERPWVYNRCLKLFLSSVLAVPRVKK